MVIIMHAPFRQLRPALPDDRAARRSGPDSTRPSCVRPQTRSAQVSAAMSITCGAVRASNSTHLRPHSISEAVSIWPGRSPFSCTRRLSIATATSASANLRSRPVLRASRSISASLPRIVELHDHREAAAQRGIERIHGVVLAEVGGRHDQQVIARTGKDLAVVLRHTRHIERPVAFHVRDLPAGRDRPTCD